jgi:hypothetical protein
VVGRESALGDVSSGLDTGDEHGGTDPTEIAETGPDIEDVDTGSSAGEDEGIDRDDVEATDVVTTGIDDDAVRAGSGSEEEGTDESEASDEGGPGAPAENEQG